MTEAPPYRFTLRRIRLRSDPGIQRAANAMRCAVLPT
ncbi:hypothetical protein SPHINGOT1_150038 [Sphingomonas sp. T1]|nr:hypothetical protein SPHINGOT1_150038 [Sphingomonas sp. T1]